MSALFIFQVIAKIPTAIIIVAGVFLIWWGSMTGDQKLVELGTKLVWWGVGLQVLYLILRYGLPAILDALD